MKNEYGLDVSYFDNLLKRLVRDLDRYKPDELARQLARISLTADSSVIEKESEFNKAQRV